MRRDDARRAGGVDGRARALQPEREGDAAARDRAGGRRCCVDGGGALLCRSTSVYSEAHMPTQTPVSEPIRSALLYPVPCSASYDFSSASRCAGSITAASAGETLKKALSKRSESSRKPALRCRSMTTSETVSYTVLVMSSGSQRVIGTGTIEFLPVAAVAHTLALPSPCAPSGPCAAMCTSCTVRLAPSPRSLATNCSGSAVSPAELR